MESRKELSVGKRRLTKCNDGRKHVVVSGYQKKGGADVSIYIRSCPSIKSKRNNDVYSCCVCGEEYCVDNLHNVNIKGETKKICNECVDHIHGLM